MKKLTRVEYNELRDKLAILEYYLNGGKGSGNFGHKGRPGFVGGSGKGGSISDSVLNENISKVGLCVDPYEVGESGLTKTAITGVPGDIIPDTVPEMKGLTPKQKKLQEAIVDEFNNKAKLKKNLDKTDELMETMQKFSEEEALKLGNNPECVKLTYETDAVKQLLPGWGMDFTKDKKGFMDIRKKMDKGEATEEEKRAYYEMLKNRQENNSIYHQTANAIAKMAFERKLSTMPDATVVVTTGGCASGKSFGLSIADKIKGKSDGGDFGSIIKKADIVYDSAGDANATELNFIKNNKNVKEMVVVHTVADASLTSQNLVSRARKKGRMVDTTVFAQSYTIGQKNVMAFYDANKNNANIHFFKVDNTKRKREYKEDGSYKYKQSLPQLVAFTTVLAAEKKNYSVSKLRKIVEQNIIEATKENSKYKLTKSEARQILNGGNFFAKLVEKYIK